MAGYDPNLYEWETHLQEALCDLPRKCSYIDRMWRYYDGDHPRVWLTRQIADMFEELADDFAENWCEVAIDQYVRRMEITGWVSDSTETEALLAEQLFENNDLDVVQSDLFRERRVAGEAYLFLWQSADGAAPDAPSSAGPYEVKLIDARQVYWPESVWRTDPEWVARVWEDRSDGVWRATLYYPADVVRLVGPQIKKGPSAGPDDWPGVSDFRLDENPEDPSSVGGEHGFGEVPIVRIAMKHDGKSALHNLTRQQDKINKLAANKMVSAEFSAIQQRWYLTRQTIQDGDLDVRPDKAIVLHPGLPGEVPTSVGTFPAADIGNYDRTLEAELVKLFTLAVLPRHLMANPGSPPSGDALEADEGPMIEVILDDQRGVGAAFRDLYRIIGLDVKPQWRNPRTRRQSEEVATVKSAVDAGVPLAVALQRYAGWTTEEVDAMESRPASMQSSMAALQGLGTATALGAVDPASAQAVANQILGQNPPEPDGG